jgi:ABC-type phosphate transport system ATPase subunit
MKRQTKLTQQEQEQLATGQQQLQSSAREFASVEEMLRHDALHTPLPPTIAHRLEESIGQSPPPPGRAWWRRLLGP